MTQQEALTVLVQTAYLAQAKGVLQLKDAVIVAQAIELFTVEKKEEATQEEDNSTAYEESPN
jgi:hypothetical protein